MSAASTTEAMSGQTPVREVWATADGQQVPIEYDDRGCTEITRECLTGLLTDAGLERVS